MLRKPFILLLIASIALMTWQCNDNPPQPTQGFEYPRSAGGDTLGIHEDEDFLVMGDVIDDFIGRCPTDSVLFDSLGTAYFEEDWDRVDEILGYEEGEADSLLVVAGIAWNNLAARYAEVIYPLSQGACDPCQDGDFFLTYQVAPPPLALRLHAGDQTELDCDYIPFMICLGACAFTGGRAYPFCAYFCICGFCEGDWADTICFRSSSD